MKKLILTFVLGLLMVGPASAARVKVAPYAMLSGGIGSNSRSGAAVEDWDYNFSGAIGLSIKSRRSALHSEIGIAYSKFDGDHTEEIAPSRYYHSASTQVMSTYMMNFYHDFLREYIIQPYVGFGVGLMALYDDFKAWDVNNNVSTIMTKEDQMYYLFAYGLYAGFGIRVSENFMFDIGGAFQSSPEFENTVVKAGIRYKF